VLRSHTTHVLQVRWSASLTAVAVLCRVSTWKQAAGMIHSVGVAELSRSAEVVSHSLHCVSTEVVVLACRLQCSHNHPTHHTAPQSAACITDTRHVHLLDAYKHFCHFNGHLQLLQWSYTVGWASRRVWILFLTPNQQYKSTEAVCKK